MPAIAQHAKLWFYQIFLIILLFHSPPFRSLTSIQPFVCRNILANDISDQQVTLFNQPGGFKTLFGHIYPAVRFLRVGRCHWPSVGFLERCVHIAALQVRRPARADADRWQIAPRAAPPASLSDPLSARVDHVTPRPRPPPHASKCHRTVVVKLNPYGVVFFWIESLTTCPTMSDAI